MEKEQEEIRFALGAIDDYRRLIAVGKVHRFDVVKWTVTINAALIGASIALRQSVNFLPLAVLVAVLGGSLMLEVNGRLTNTRRGSRKPEQFLIKRGIAVSEIAETDPQKEVGFWRDFFYDWQELLFYAFILAFSTVPLFYL